MARTLLLADDSVTIQRVIELSFANEDVRVVSVSDGRRAVQWIDAERPDIVLVDVEVPEVDGYAVARHVKASASLRHIPVVLLAGAFEPVDEGKAHEAGCDDILVKPFEPQQLVSRVKELLARARNGASSPFSSVRPDEPKPALQATSPPEGAGAVQRVSGRPASPASLEVPPVPELPPVEARPEPLMPPVRPFWDPGLPPDLTPSSAPPAAPSAPAPAPARVSLVNAFTALLAAEQSSHPLRAPESAVAMSDAAVEAAVRRVLTRMTDDAVRRIVTETAERLIREEIEKIRNEPE